MAKNDSDNAKLAEQILCNPFPPQLSETEEKVRRNLLVAISLSLLFTMADLHIAEGSSIFGIRFQSLPDMLAYRLLLLFTAYQLLHYSIIAINTFKYWRVRMTGIDVVFQTSSTVGGEEYRESVQDPRHSSLYTWWNEKSNILRDYKEAKRSLEYIIEARREDFNEASMLEKVSNSAEKIERHLRIIEGILNSKRIPASLSRFNNWYRSMAFWQHFRWLFIDLAIPIGGGFISCSLLVIELH